MLVGAVCGLLYNRLRVSAEGLDESLLCLGAGRLDCKLPKPVSMPPSTHVSVVSGVLTVW
jgi:hypothetical protein